MSKKITAEKLTSLTKEQKLALYDAIQEKKRRKREQRAVYVPNAGQLVMHQSRATIRFNLSGNAAGKTTAAMQEAFWAASGYNPILKEHTKVPANVVIVLDQPSKVRDVYLGRDGLSKWFEIKEEQLKRDGKPYISRIAFDNGSQITFLFHDQEELVYEGTSCDFAIYDEPVDRRIFISLLRGGRTKGHKAKHLFIGTPIGSKSAWIRDYFQEWKEGKHPDLDFFQTSSEVNRANLADGFIENFAKHLTERERASRLEGNFFDVEGLALAGLFIPEKHILHKSQLPEDHKRALAYVIAADPHPQKKLAACLLGVDASNNRYYVDEFHEKILPADFASWLKNNWLKDYNIQDLIVDNYGSGEYTGGQGFRSWVEVMRTEGVRFRPTTYDEKSDDKFLERIKDSLILNEDGSARFGILDKCYKIIHNIKNVGWKPVKGTEMFQPKLEIGEWDHLACLKYALAANLTHENSKRKVIKTAAKSPWAGKSTQPGWLEAKQRARKRLDDDDDDDFSKW